MKELEKASLNFSDKQFDLCAKQKIDRFIKTHEQTFKRECHFKQDIEYRFPLSSYFILKNKDWLERELIFNCEVIEQQVSAAEQNQP